MKTSVNESRYLKPGYDRLYVRVKSDVARRLRMEAVLRSVTLQELCNEVLAEHVTSASKDTAHLALELHESLSTPGSVVPRAGGRTAPQKRD